FFAWFPQPIVGEPAKDDLLRWMDCNKRLYPPVRDRHFIPSPSYSLTAKGFIWDDSWQVPVAPPARYCTRYLAVEPAGWVEYGFSPGAAWEDEPNTVYYAKVVGSLVGFLAFARELAGQFGLDSAGVGLGMALRGTTGKHLLALRQEGMRQSTQ